MACYPKEVSAPTISQGCNQEEVVEKGWVWDEVGLGRGRSLSERSWEMSDASDFIQWMGKKIRVNRIEFGQDEDSVLLMEFSRDNPPTAREMSDFKDLLQNESVGMAQDGKSHNFLVWLSLDGIRWATRGELVALREQIGVLLGPRDEN